MNQKLKLLPKGIQSFEKMINNNYIYVDKTKNIYDMITTGSYYFLSRPRRFGKSLLVSTLFELFSGKKELFKGLWIEKSDYDWQKHPVIHLSLSAIASNNPQALHDDLLWKLESIATAYNIDLSKPPSLQAKFEHLVIELSKIKSVVILVDEYDYPILSNVNSLELASECRNILRTFFAVIKDLDPYLHFVFFTGVSKFSKTSIFSGLNNLEDLTVTSQGATLLGYTQAELITYFEPYIEKVAIQNNSASVQIIETMKLWYDGYQFCSDSMHKVYNPYSVLLFLSSGNFLNYWFETGTPTFLINLIKKRDFAITTLDTIKVSTEELGTIDIEDIPIPTLLFQTGYLTIKSYDAETKNYHLVFPNFEVESSFLKHLLKMFAKLDVSTISEFAFRLTKAVQENNIDLFCRLLQTFFADIPSGIQIPHLEKYYQTILFVLAKILGLVVHVEVMTNIGRIDMTIETTNNIHIFEFKIQGSAQEALHQIEEKKYYQKYLMSQKKITLIGVLFDLKKRNIDDWIIKNIDIAKISSNN